MVFVDTTQKNDAGQPITTITLGGTVIVVDVCIGIKKVIRILIACYID